MNVTNVICRRVDGKAVVEGITQAWVWHSPTGFEWGYGGSGPADLALNILLAITKDREFAKQHHQSFKWRFVAPLPSAGGVIQAEAMESWIRERSPSKAKWMNAQH